MSKAAKEQKNFPPTKKTPEMPSVEKVVNQRYTNGKKEYKVIWTGKPFEEATWVEESKLNCPDKISEFMKRYQQVMKKKNLQPKIQTITPVSSSPMKLESAPKPEPKKLTLEKPDNGTQQKLVLNQSANLNKQKLQASLQKNNLIPPKKNPESEAISQTFNGIKSDPTNYKGQTQSHLENYSQFSSKISNETVAKSQKLTENDRKDFSTVSKGKNSQGSVTKKIDLVDNDEQETAETEDQFLLELQQQTFIDSAERLDIEKICGIVLNFEGDIQKWTDSLVDQSNRKIQTPTFFLVQNKFSLEQKLISRERMFSEQPLKLIDYYENLLQESQQVRG